MGTRSTGDREAQSVQLGDRDAMEEPMRRVAIILTCLALLAFAAYAEQSAGAIPRESVSDESGEQAVSLPSGATLKISLGWTMKEFADGLILEGPESQLSIEVVELWGSSDLRKAIAEAWSLRHPDFDREIEASSDTPGREGWDDFQWANYKTSPEENRLVYAWAARKDSLAVVTLVNVPMGDYQRRSSEFSLVWASLRPAGYVREMYTGKQPHTLDEERIAQLREFIERARKAADVPGLAVALFDKDKTLLEAGFGVRHRGRDEPVTPETLFLIASNSKPLTTLLMAKLVDEGYFEWDTPVTEVYPSFKLGKPETTRRVLMKHLVCACTGLPRQDFEWLFTFEGSSPEEQLEVLATMEPTTEFGALFQYSNPLASAAGYIAAHLVLPGISLGQAYDKVMYDKVFAPLNMERTTLSFEEVLRTDYAAPHAFDLELKNVPAEFDLNRCVLPVRPAGGVWSNASDYARYVQMELANGLLPDGSRYISDEALLERRQVQVRVSEEAWYGIGLFIEDIKGIRVFSHGGSLIGYKSDFFFVPEVGLGGVILTNADTGYGVATAIKRRVLEVCFDGNPEAEEDLMAGIRSNEEYYRGTQKDWTVPPEPEPVEQLASKYRSSALGDIQISHEGEEVIFRFEGWKSRVATKHNPDGTISFVTIDPGIQGFEFVAPGTEDKYERLTLRDPQHTYPFEAVEASTAPSD